MADIFEDLRFGCVVFDDPRSREQGWKAIGEDNATRVSMEGTGALRSDVVWLTNMSYDATNMMGLRDNYRFLQSAYLREDFSDLCRRYNIADARQAAEFGAKLLSRSMRLSAKLLNADENFPVKTALRYGFREIAGFGKNPCVPTEIAKIVDDATIYNTNCERDWNDRENDVVGYFKIPQREHCQNILSSPLPYGDFVEIPKQEIPPANAGRKAIQQFLMDTANNPGFFKITCERFNPAFNDLINFGDSPNMTGPYRRSWVTLPEAIMLSSLSDIVIHQGYVSTSIYTLKTAMDIAKNLPIQADLSITEGIFFENLWTGMAVVGKRSCLTDPLKVYINTFTPFIRAHDRLLLLDKAIAFKKAGFEVLGYAAGRLRVNLAGKNPLDAYRLSLATDMIPPFLGLSPDDLPAMPEEEMERPLRFMQVWHATNNLSEMMEWDKKVVDYLLED